MAYIVFNGTQFDNGMTAVAGGVGSRFANWTPFTTRIGQSARTLASGAMSMFTFRIDYGATFEMRDIPNTSVATALSLIRWMQNGGVVRVNTQDGNVAHDYTNCVLSPDAMPTLTMTDATELRYTLSLSVINLSGADMLCEYTA